MKDIVKKEIDTLLSIMNIEADYKLDVDDIEGVTYFNICFEGENLGYLIGNHGRHLDSFQYVLQMMLRKNFEEDFNYRVILDVCDYRKEKNEKLEKFALQKADDARILGEPVDLPPMNPFDRRIVHMTLQKFDDITTESFGEGSDRYVRIIPKGEFDIDTKGTEEDDEESEE